MKYAIFLGLFLLILPNAFASFSFPKLVEVELRELELEKPLVASIALEKTLQTMVDKHLENEEGNEPYNTALLCDLMRFISLHRSSLSALTAKLYLGRILLTPCYYYLDDDFASDKEPFKRIRDNALAILKSVSSDFPDTWQGKSASIFSPERFALQLAKDKAALLPILQADIPLAQELDQEPQFAKFGETLFGTYGSEEEVVRYDIISYLLDLKRWKEARDEFEIFRVKFPQISWVEELSKRIKSEAK